MLCYVMLCYVMLCLIYFHAYIGPGYFGGFKILNFNIFGVFQKTEIFLGV